MDIYWIRDKKRCGPATVPDVISLVQMGELTRDTLGWHSGCEKWMSLEKLPALSDFLDDLEPRNRAGEQAEDDASDVSGSASSLPEGLPPLPPKQHGEAPAGTFPSRPQDGAPGTTGEPEPFEGEGEPGGLPGMARRVYLPSPGVRFFARCIDYSLYLSFFYLVIYVMGIEFDLMLMPGSYLIWLPCAIIEGFYLSRMGTTPGKALMGIRLNVFGDVENISVLRGTMRALLVFIMGCGMMFFPLAVIMGILTLWLLRRRGITSWDARCSTLPIQVIPASTERILAGLGIIFVSLVAVGFFLTPWTGPMLQALEEQQPGITQKMAPLLPPQYAAIAEDQDVIPQPTASPSKLAPTSVGTRPAAANQAPPAGDTQAPSAASEATPVPAAPDATPAPAAPTRTSEPTGEQPRSTTTPAPQPTLLETLSQDPMLSSVSASPAILRAALPAAGAAPRRTVA